MTSRVLHALRRGVPALAIAALLWALGRQRGAAWLALGAGLLVVLGLIAPNAAARLDRALAHAARMVATALSVALSGAAFLVAVLPVWGVSRLRTPPLLAASPRGTAWSRSSALRARSPDGTPLESSRAGSTHTSPVDSGHPVRTLFAALAVTALLTVGLTTAGRAWDLRPRTEAPTDRSLGVPAADAADVSAAKGPVTARDLVAQAYNGFPVDGYAHEDEPFAPELFGEYLQLPYRTDFFLGHRIGDFDGRYVDIVDGRRVSYTPEDPELTVWFFGGSTMFGIGQRDDHTLPSVVARLAETDGIRIRAVNFGVSGYVNWQSLEQFEQALTSDELEPPDLAVFYEGINELGLGTERTELGDVRPGTISRLGVSDEERTSVAAALDNTGSMPWSEERTRAIIELSADQYRRGAELVDVLGISFGVPVVRFWQPSPYAKVASPADDELWRRVGFDPAGLPASAANYREIWRRSGVNAIDLTEALDNVDRPVYLDHGHTNEYGARVIGEAMYAALQPQLAGRSG